MRPHANTRRPGTSCAAVAALALTAVALAAAPAAAATAATISIDELAVGQRGYGLTVFSGSEPQRFEAEVVGVMRNTSPGVSFILARLTGHDLETIGVASGMSGSPVYFDGRLAGAVAFSWPYSREAIAGITPIALMRRIPGRPAVATPPLPAVVPTFAELAARRAPAGLLERELARLRPRLAGDAAPAMQWAMSGFGDATRDLLQRALGSGGAPAGEAAPGAATELVPGGPVAALLVDGDFKLAAAGTVTDVDGDEVLAFGHPVLGVGPVEVPMAAAEVVTVLSSSFSSFKIANVGPVVGAFVQDRSPGVRGRLGASAPMVPVTLRVHGPGGSDEFHMRITAMPQLAPAMLTSATIAGLEAATRANGLQGLDMVARFYIAGHGELTLEQSFDGPSGGANLASTLITYAAFLLQNDFGELALDRVEIDLEQAEQPRTARLLAAHAERGVVRPGERLRLNLDLAAYRGEPFRHSLTVDIPHNLADGRYFLFVGDGPSVDAARLAVERAEPVNLRQALEFLRSLHARRELVVLGVTDARGLAVAGEVLPELPGSMRSIWSAAGDGGAQPLRLAVKQEKVEAMEFPVDGLVRVDLRVERREPLAPGGETPPAEGGAGGEGGR